MTTTDIISSMLASRTSLAASLAAKGQSAGSSDTLRSLARKLNLLPYSNRKGGSIRVIVIDYDGTLLLDEYRIPGETIRLSPSKAMTCHDRLVFDCWVSNVPITDGATSDDVSTLTVPDDNDVLIAPIYHTTSGKTEFDVTVLAGGQVSINGTGTFDWGDGITDSGPTHTYSSAGSYTILFDGTFTSTPYIGDCCTEIRFPNTITAIEDGFISGNSLLERISLPPGLVTLSPSTDLGGMTTNRLSVLAYPKTVTALGDGAFRYMGNGSTSSDKYVVLPYGLSTVGQYMGADMGGSLYCPLPSTVSNGTSTGLFANTILASRVCTTLLGGMFGQGSFGRAATDHIVFSDTVTSLGDDCFHNATVGIYDFVLCHNVPAIGQDVFPASGDYVIRVSPDTYQAWVTALQGYYARTKIQPIHIERGLYEKCLSLISDRDSITGALSPMIYDDLDDAVLSECSNVLDGIGYREVSAPNFNSPESYSGQYPDRFGTIFSPFHNDVISAINGSSDWEIYLRTTFPSGVAHVIFHHEMDTNRFYYGDYGWQQQNRQRFSIMDSSGTYHANSYIPFPYSGGTSYECRTMFHNGLVWIMRRIDGESNWLRVFSSKTGTATMDIGDGNDVTWGESGNSQPFYFDKSYIMVDGSILWSSQRSAYGGLCCKVSSTPLTYNVVRTGGTLSNGLFTGASGAYLTLPYIQTYDYDSWWFEFSYRYADNGDTFSSIIGQYDLDNSGYTLSVMDGQLAINALDSSGSWIFADAQTGLYPAEGTEYHIRCGYDNGTYFLDYRLDSSDPYTRQWSYSSNAHNYQNDSNICLMGSRLYDTSRFNLGTMDLNTFKFYGNGQLLWYKGNMTIS